MSLGAKPFDKKQLADFDRKLSEIVSMDYDLCMSGCNMTAAHSGIAGCKQNCFKRIIVPYRHTNHVAKDQEDVQYKACLAKKLPNITKDDFMTCSNNIFSDRVEVLTEHYADVAQRILKKTHSEFWVRQINKYFI